MSHIAVIKIARAYDPDALLGPVRGSGDMYAPGGLTFLRRESAPVVIDHDPGKQVGEVHELVVWPFTDQRWVVARVRLDTPPGWIKQGTPASFGSRRLWSYELNGWRVISRALVDEVSIVSASHRPVEACAEVVLLRRSAAAAAPRTGDVVIPANGLIRRPGIGQVLGVR